MDLKEKYSSKHMLEKYEKELAENPSSSKLRAEILRAYFFIFPDLICSDKAKAHVVWFIEHAPDFEGPWHEWSTHFLDSSGDERRVIRIWKTKLNKRIQVVRNAAVFSTHLDSQFSRECYELLRKLVPNDPSVLDALGKLLLWNRDRSEDSRREIEKSFQIFRQRLEMNWTQESFEIFDRIRQTALGFFIPSFLNRLILRLISEFKKGPDTDRLWALGVALESAMLLKQDSEVKKWSGELSAAIDKAGKAVDRTTLKMAHFALAKSFLSLGDLSKASIYIRKVSSDRVDSIFEFREFDEPLIRMMIEKNEILMAEKFLKARADHFSDDPEFKTESLNLFGKNIFLK